MEVQISLRVVRGPDWQWGDQDGGEGHVGTVVEVGGPSDEDGQRAVVVQWDCGQRCRYRCGVGGKYDLRVLDSAPAGLKHGQKRCYGCREEEIVGVLWQCVKCFEYFLCTPCYMTDKHSLQHTFMRIDTNDLSQRTRVPARAMSRAVKAIGIYPQAVVVRGHDWKWANQDGGPGTLGEVVSVIGQKDSKRSVVEVLWKSASKKNIYRVGLKGKVDLKLVPGGGRCAGYYYPEHLVLLGAPYEPPKETQFAAGDQIKVELDPDLWREMQMGHGGWNEAMAMYIGISGVVMSIDNDGDLMVNYHGNAMFHVNAAAVTKVEGPAFRIGDTVRVMEDLEEVTKMQKGHGEWNETMQSSLGQVGKVIKTLPNGDIRISVDGNKWIFNPGCLKLAHGEKPSEKSESSVISLLDLLRLDTFDGSINSELVEVAVRRGKVKVLKDYFTKYPNEINTNFSDGKSALHIAVSEGLVNVIEVLLEFKPDLNITDSDGDTPLLDCAHLNQYAIAELLIQAGADVNKKNAVGIYPIMVAAALGHHKVLKVMANAKGANLGNQDVDTNTALHISVMSHRNESVAILLEAGADPTLYNQGAFSPILEAARNGFYGGMEQFMAYFPGSVNMPKVDDGHTALHIAAANNHLDIVHLLASMETCDLNAKNDLKQLTPLHLSAQRGYSRIIECLVGYGANVNARDMAGHNVLHAVITMQDMKPPSEQTPELTKIHDKLTEMSAGVTIPPYVTVACFLVREGAELGQSNPFGIDPMQLIPTEMATLIRVFSRLTHDRAFTGSFKRHPQESYSVGSARTTATQKQPITESKSQQTKSQLPMASSETPQTPTNISPSHSKDQKQQTSVQQPDPKAHVSDTTVQSTHSPTKFKPSATAAASTLPTPELPQPLPSSVQHLGTDAQAEPIERDGPPIKQTSVGSHASPTVTAKPASVQGTEPTANRKPLCLLCENPANVKFLPCGHVSMCNECAHSRVKKCPSCKTPIHSKTEFK